VILDIFSRRVVGWHVADAETAALFQPLFNDAVEKHGVEPGPYGAERVEAAAERAIEIGAKTYGSVKSILDNKLDRRPARKRGADGTPIQHANIRGPRYYH
jgi:transposase